MALHELWPTHDEAAPLPDSVRRQIARLPEPPPGADMADHRPPLDVFSIARIYTTFRIALKEHFPEDLGDAAFDLLVDILIYEWLARRLGTLYNAPFGITRDAAKSRRIETLHDARLISLDPDPGRDDLLVVHLTSSARARMGLFFDYMGRYISAIAP